MVQTSEPSSPEPQKAKRKGFRLFKRGADCREIPPDAEGYRDKYYYFRFQFRGKNYVRCLETNDAVEAQKRSRLKSKQIKDAIIRGEYDLVESTKLRSSYSSTIKEICEAYDQAPVDAQKKTRRQNVLALLQLLRNAHGETTTVENLVATEASTAVVRKWFETASAKAMAATDQVDALSIKESANSRFVQASSLFTDRARAHYAGLGLDHPAFAEFCQAGNLLKFRRLPTRHYNPPAEDIIKQTLEAWRAIEDCNLFLAIGHELAFGLRAGEMGQAKWGWWTVRAGYPVLDGVAKVKNGSGLVQVRALDPWFNIMRERVVAEGWRGGAEDFIITGNATFRTDDIFRAVSEWLRNLKWNTIKTNHALRAYAGSQVAMKYGIYEAQCWLRHSTVKVTEQHYTHFIKRFRPADLDTLPARWANLQQTLELRIVDQPAVV